MKAFSPLPVLSALALALGASGACAQSSASSGQATPVTPPAASSAATPPTAGAPSSDASPAGADASAADRSGSRYGRGYGRGPGMMGGYGPGMMGGVGPGYGYGPGYGPGYGMGRGGGYGPGFGAGPDVGCGGGMGPGMMGGPGWGMGPGMMGGYGPGWGAGPGRALGSLDLDDAQRRQLRELQQQQRRDNWALMGQIHDEREKLQDAWGAGTGTRDRAAILAASRRIAELRQKLLESRLDAAERLDTILTPEQREQLRSQWSWAPGRAGR